MLYMKEMRAKVVAECTLKESAAINQILGRRVSVPNLNLNVVFISMSFVFDIQNFQETSFVLSSARHNLFDQIIKTMQ